MSTSRRASVAAQFTVLTALAATSVAVASKSDAAVIPTPYGCNSQVTVKAGYNGECARAVQWTMNAWIARTSQKIPKLTISGTFDAATTTAVTQFERANGLAANGVIDSQSWPALIKEATMVSGTTVSTTPSNSPAPTVSRMTTYPTTNVRSAASTSSSIVGTLKAGTTLTGVLSNGWLKVNIPAQYAGKYVSDSVLKPSTPSVTTPPSNTSAQPVGQLKTPFGCNTRYTLTVGGKGECVKSVAYVLNSWNMKSGANFKILPTDGIFTSAMRTELQAFQKAQQVNQSGLVDAATWAAIEKVSQGTATSEKLAIPTVNQLDHQAFPGAVKLADGRLMAVIRGGMEHLPAGTNVTTLWMAYSPDNGYTWTTPQKVNVTIPGGQQGALVAYTDPSLSIPKTGSLAGRPILTFFTYTFASTSANLKNSVPPARAWIAVSNDQAGSSWGTPQPLNFSVIGRSFMSSAAQQLDDEHYVSAGYGNVNTSGVSAQAFMTALSIGLTWDGQKFVTLAPTVMGHPADDYIMTEPNIVALHDGRLLGLIRVDPKDSAARLPSYIFATYSSDNGKTWTPANQLFEGTGNPHVTQLTNGTLVVAYRHLHRADWGAGNPPSGVRYAVYRVSHDGGLSWSAERHIGPADSQYEMAYAVPVETAPNKVTFVWGDESDTGGVSQIQIGTVDFN